MDGILDAAGTHGLSAGDLFSLFNHFLVLSIIAIGGAITTVADMHRYLVVEQGWMTDATFISSIAIAQAAPGPNVLFVAVLGWNAAGLLGVCATMLGIMVPSTALALLVARWGARQTDGFWLRVFTLGLGPLTIGLLLSTGWVLTEPVRSLPMTWVLVGGTVLVMMASRCSPLWLIAAGGVVGALGWV
jgi:chromate transporter